MKKIKSNADKKRGDTVFSLTINVAGSLIVKTEKIGKDTTMECYFLPPLLF